MSPQVLVLEFFSARVIRFTLLERRVGLLVEGEGKMHEQHLRLRVVAKSRTTRAAPVALQ